MNSQLKELYDLFSIETVENCLTELKELQLELKQDAQLLQIDLELYLDERKGKEVLNNV